MTDVLPIRHRLQLLAGGPTDPQSNRACDARARLPAAAPAADLQGEVRSRAARGASPDGGNSSTTLAVGGRETGNSYRLPG